MENPPQPLPEAVRGDALTISEISIGELKSAENWPIEFGDIFPIQQDLDAVSYTHLTLPTIYSV